MPTVTLRGPLKQMAGNRGKHAVAGDTVVALLKDLERCQPAVAGWILDECGDIRRHINVFVNGEPAEPATTVTDADRVDVLPAISGGSV